MLQTKNRLKKRKEFNYIYKFGKTASAKYVTLFYSDTKRKDIKIGFSVSKKIGHAVTRNLVKRRMRECVRVILPNMKKDITYIFVARSGIENLTYSEINNNILAVLNKNGFLNEKNN